MKSEVTKEQIDAFLNGSDPMERIIKMECDYNDDIITIIYNDEKGRKRCLKEPFKPMVWTKTSAACKLFNGDRKELKYQMSKYGIGVKSLRTENTDGIEPLRMSNGYKLLFYAKTPMTYTKFMDFFQKGGVPIYSSKDEKNYIAVAPVEQYMIQTGRRLFKGYNDYDELVRMQWDLETTGLDPKVCHINQIGIRTNKGFEKILTVGDDLSEIDAIYDFFTIIKEIKPDVISGHNTENFDWNFIDVRLQTYGTSLKEFSKNVFPKTIYKKNKQSVLKLGGETEYYYPTIMYGYNLTDSLFAVRRAQALNSNIKKADLKYITKFSKLNKPNRVYVPGKIIGDTWADNTETYALNESNGDWFKITNKKLSSRGLSINNDNTKILNQNGEEEYNITTGKYIVERYLLDDLYETDKVEHKFNITNFFICKMLPVSFERMCTMGTAAVWKYIMLAWSYENGLAVPDLISTKPFTGGLSRLLKVGFVKNVVKLDYNSLYPSIILSYDINSPIDIMGTMSSLLEYILTQREYYKGLKKKYGKNCEKLQEELEIARNENNLQKINDIKKQLTENEMLESLYDNLQTAIKVIGNGFFGSYGSGTVFPWSDIDCAEQTTATGRQCLRLMISHFTNIGYTPIVGDTDGFNFQMPNIFRYTEENPYISNGKGRNTVEGKSYTGVDADVAEFEDLYLCEPYTTGINKMGLGIDEFCDSCIQFARKNYADLMPDGKIKLVGNSIKSKKMPIYIEKFLNKGIDLLLHNKGKEFLEYYYDYIEKIYNLQIPLKDIASVGKIKTNISTYKEACKELTKGGTKKARQAWYELAIKHDLNVNMGDAIYYINTGVKKNDSDVQRITHYYGVIDGEEKDLTKEVKKAITKHKKENSYDYNMLNDSMTTLKWGEKLLKTKLREEDKLIFNCVLLTNDIVEDEEDHFCDESFEYNVDKYIEMFNKRIKPLLVCFSKDIRIKINEKGKEVNNILINNPKDRKNFTEEESVLVLGEPYNVSDQDTYEQLMTMEDKEISFWTSVNKIPPYTKECGMNWDKIVSEYNERVEKLSQEGIKDELDEFKKIISELKKSDVDDFIENGTLPSKMEKLIYQDRSDTTILMSKKYDVALGTIYDLLDLEFNDEKE